MRHLARSAVATGGPRLKVSAGCCLVRFEFLTGAIIPVYGGPSPGSCGGQALVWVSARVIRPYAGAYTFPHFAISALMTSPNCSGEFAYRLGAFVKEARVTSAPG